jgi:hypothetical protein
MSEPFREINNYERNLLKKILTFAFEGKEEIRQQLANAKVRTLEVGDNYGSIEFEINPAAKKVVTTQRVPIELEGYDKDSVPISILLHVANGIVDELEIFKADGTPIAIFPSAEDFNQKSWQEG